MTEIDIGMKLSRISCGCVLDNCPRGPVEGAKHKRPSLVHCATGLGATAGESFNRFSEMLVMVRETLRGWRAGSPLMFEERFGLVASVEEGMLFGRAR